MQKDTVSGLTRSQELSTMSTDLMQQNMQAALQANHQLEQLDLNPDITSLEEVEEIVKSNLLKMRNDSIHDGYSYNEYHDDDDVAHDDDLLKMMNLQISDLDIFETPSAEDTEKHQIMPQEIPKSALGCSEISEIAQENSQMPQSAEDLLEDITLVINSDKKFAVNCNSSVKATKEQSGRDVLRPDLQEARTISGAAIRETSPSSMHQTSNTNQRNTDAIESYYRNNEILKTNFQTVSSSVNGECYNWSPQSKSHSSVALKPPAISQEASSDSSKSVDIIPDNSSVDGSYVNPEYHLVERSSVKHPPGHHLETVTHSGKIRNTSNLQRRQFGGDDGDDVTVDGEDDETCRRESVELYPLTYDENLMCSFDELQLHQDEDTELVAHGNGTRGRPARSKVVKPAVPCRIEPKVSRSELAAQKALYPPMISATGQRFPGTYSSVIPASLQPHQGKVTQRFPVVLHNDPKSNGQVYLEVFPKTSDPNLLTRPTPSPSPSLRSSPLRSVRGKSVDRATDETMDLENEGSNNFEEPSSQPYFKRDTRDLFNKPQLSLEVDGPIHHQILSSQARAEKNNQTTNCYRDQSFSNGSTSEVSLSMQGPSQNHCNTMSSDISQPYMFNPRSFPTSSHSLTGASHYRNTSAAVWQGNQSGQASIPLFSSIQTPVPASIRIPTSQTFNNLTSQTSSLHSQMHQVTHYNNFGSPVNSFHYNPYCDCSQPYGNWSGQPSISSGPVSVGSQYASHDPSRQAFVSGATASTSSPVKSAGCFPSTLADPRSKRWRTLLEMGNPGLKVAQADGSKMMMSGSFEGAVPQHPVQCPGVATAASHHLPGELSNTIQLSPPVRSQTQGQVKQKQQKEPHQGHTQLPAGATSGCGSAVTPGHNVTEKKKHIQARSVPSHSSNRSSSKGPEIPVPVERSKKRVQSWLENNIMFRPDLDSGTFDPSDHSLKPEPSLPGTARLCPSNTVIEQGLSDEPCEVVGIFGKSMVLPQPAGHKQKAAKKRIMKSEHAREQALRQVGHKGYSIASNSSVISEPSFSTRNRNGSKEREQLHRNSPSSFCLETGPLKLSGKVSPYSEIMASKNGLEDQGGNKVVQGSLPAQEQAALGEYQVDDKQVADMEIAERLKQLQQIISSIASTPESSQVLSELGQFLLASSGSGNNHNSLKMEATVSDSSKSSFDASKYITQSEIESLEKKKAQTGKSSLDGYLDHMRNSSNDSMGSLPNPTQVTDVKPLIDIPLKDITEVIGSSGEFGHQLLEPVPCGPPHLVFEHRQKAMKRRTFDSQAEAAFLNGQTVTSTAMVHKNQSSDSSRAVEGSGPSNQSLNHKTSSTSSHQTTHPSDKTGPNYLMNSRDQRLAEYNAQRVSEAWTAAAFSCLRDQSSTQPNTSMYGENMGLASQTYTTSNESNARPLYGSYTNQNMTPATRPLYGNYTNQEVAPSSISAIPRCQNVLQDLTTPSQIFNPEVNTSMEISVSGEAISDPAMFMDTTINQSGSFPVPGSQVNEAQNLLKSGQPSLTMLQQLSSSTSSQINDPLFKKPQAVVGHKKGASFPSVEGDSDVSMASEKSLSGNLPLLGSVGPPEKSLSGILALQGTVGPPMMSKHDQLLFQQNYLQQQQQEQQLNHQQFVPSVLSQDQQLNHQHLNHRQFVPTAQHKPLQMQTLQQLHQIPSHQQQQTHVPMQPHMQIPLQQQQQHIQIPSQQMHPQKTQVAPKQMQIPSNQQQQMQASQHIQAPQQIHNSNIQPQTQHFLIPKPNVTNLQGPAGTSSHSAQPQEPLNFLLSTTAQTVIQERSASGVFNFQQHSRIIHEKDSTTPNPSNILLSSACTSATTNETQLHVQGIQHHFGEAFPGSSSAHPAFINTLVDQSFGSRMSSVESSSGDAKDNGLKNSAESQLQQYLIGRFPSLDFGDVCQDKLSLSLRTPSSGQNKSNQSVDDPTNGGKMTGLTGKVQSAERSREEGDSDLSVFSVGSDEETLSFRPDNDGETPLHLLCDLPKEMREKMSTFSSIPGFSGALNLQNRNQETALHIAVKNEDVEVTRFLVSHGADVNIFCLSSPKVNRNKTSRAVCRSQTVQQTALHEAVELGNTEIVHILLTSQNIKMDSRRPDTGLTPLMLALQIHRQSDRRDIILELIKQGAQLSLQDTIQGKTPLMFAIQSKDVLLVEQILQQVGAERARQLVNERAKNDMTCLHFAAEGHLESALRRKLLRCIIVAGGDASARNSEGETPRDWARADIHEVLQNLSRLSSP